MTALPPPRSAREYEGVDRARFLEEVRRTGEPAVLRGLAAEWPAVRAARQSDEALLDYLRRFAGNRPVTAIVGQPSIGGRFFYSDDLRGLNFDRGPAPLFTLLEQVLSDRGNPQPHAVAIQSEVIPDLFPGFERENATELVAPEFAPRAWIGNRIRVAPHYDLKENIGIVVAGRRRFTLFPPEQIRNLYVGPLELTPAGTPISLVDPEAPDLERFPRYAEAAATAQTATLEPGDAIYIPFHWWHGVDSLAPFNLFVNYWWNDAPAGLGSPYDALMFAFYALKHLPPEQRVVWRTVFDHFVFCSEGDPAEHLPPDVRGVLGPLTPELRARMRSTLQHILRNL